MISSKELLWLPNPNDGNSTLETYLGDGYTILQDVATFGFPMTDMAVPLIENGARNWQMFRSAAFFVSAIRCIGETDEGDFSPEFRRQVKTLLDQHTEAIERLYTENYCLLGSNLYTGLKPLFNEWNALVFSIRTTIVYAEMA